MKGISIIICCFNSAFRIPETLRHIARQKTSPSVEWEVILVDNNSTDDTKEIAVREWKKCNASAPFQVVNETIAGLSAARAKGFYTAKYSTLVFCDDDNWLNENYVQIAFDLMNDHPSIGVAGGKVEEVCETAPPSWFNNFKYAYAVGEQGDAEGDISKRQFVWGVGMVIRKEIYTALKNSAYISFLSDRKGNNLSSGGDSELCLAGLYFGYKLWYCPRLIVKHYIPANRLQWSYLKKLTQGFGASEVGLSPMKKILMVKLHSIPHSIRFSWKREFLNILLIWLRHPKKTIKGLMGSEGVPAVLWFQYYFSYSMELFRMKSKIDKTFQENCNKLKSLKDFKSKTILNS